MSDLGRFKFKFPKPPKFARKLIKMGPPIPGIIPPQMVKKMLPPIPGSLIHKKVSYAASPEVYAPSATAASQPMPSVTSQPYYDTTVYPSGTSPDYQTPQTPMVSMPPSASVMSYDSGTPQESYGNDGYTSPSSADMSTFSVPESPTDSASYWGSESEMSGLGATTDTSWYQDIIPQITEAYTKIKAAQQAAKTPATIPSRPVVITQPSGFNINTMLMIGAAGLGGILLLTMLRKRRR